MAGRKTGQLIPRGENRWLLRWFTGREPNGKRKYSSKVFEGTTSQAQKELARLTVQVDEGTFIAPAKQTVQEYLEWWLENVCKPDVSPSTHRSYSLMLRSYIYSAVGGLKLHKLTWQALQTVYNELRKSGKSGRTVGYAHTILKQALGRAVRGKLLRENPCEHATPGSRTKPEMQVWTAEEVQLFLERTKNDRDYPLWYTLLHTGLRPGEAFGLKWSDLQSDKLSIQRAVAEQGNSGEYAIEEPKTERSKRSVVLTRENIEVLQSLRRSQAAVILAAGPEYKRLDFVFATPNGDHDNVQYARRRWKRAMNRVNGLLRREAVPGSRVEDIRQVPLIRLYDTRHTHATLLLKANVHPKIVSERLGHANISITLDTYSHVLPDMQKEAVGQLEALMAATR